MTMGSKSALGLGLVVALGLGMWVGTITIDRMAKQQPASAPQVAAKATPAEAPAAKRAVRRRAAAAARPRVSEPVVETSSVAVTSPDLHSRLRPILNRGTKIDLAADGFRDGLQFATFAHAARNTQIPLVLLKHRALNEGKSLAQAIRESKPEIDADAEAARARSEAQADIASLTNAA